MRPLLAICLIGLIAGCQRTPEQQQADSLRAEARQRGAEIESNADSEADRLQQQAETLENEAQQAGGLTGERLRVRADALAKEAQILRKQADMQADAIKEAADARIKASESR
jgi:hypothetical protein